MKKRILIIFCALLAVTGLSFGGYKVRLGSGYGWLFTPDLKEFNNIPTIQITRGGGAVNFQGLVGNAFGSERWWYGIEVDFLRSYRYEYHVPITTEVSLHSFPFLAITQYDLSPVGKFTPFLQAGAGVTYNLLITEIGAGQTTDVHNDFTLMAGPGFSYKLNDRWSVDILLQYFQMFTVSEYNRRLNLSGTVGFTF